MPGPFRSHPWIVLSVTVVTALQACTDPGFSDQERGQIYAEVTERLMLEVDSVAIVYVDNRPIADAGYRSPDAAPGEVADGGRFSDAVQGAIGRAIGIEVFFIRPNWPGSFVHPNLWLRLGPIVRDGDRLQVGAEVSGTIAVTRGQVFHLERSSGGWSVTSTDGSWERARP